MGHPPFRLTMGYLYPVLLAQSMMDDPFTYSEMPWKQTIRTAFFILSNICNFFSNIPTSLRASVKLKIN